MRLEKKKFQKTKIFLFERVWQNTPQKHARKRKGGEGETGGEAATAGAGEPRVSPCFWRKKKTARKSRRHELVKCEPLTPPFSLFPLSLSLSIPSPIPSLYTLSYTFLLFLFFFPSINSFYTSRYARRYSNSFALTLIYKYTLSLFM